MKFKLRKLITGIVVYAVLMMSEGILVAQDVSQPVSAKQRVDQQIRKKTQAESVGNLQQIERNTSEQIVRKESKQKKDVKKVQSSNPDLSKTQGARPRSISRPSGSGMPKGSGKPGGISRPGRR